MEELKKNKYPDAQIMANGVKTGKKWEGWYRVKRHRLLR